MRAPYNKVSFILRIFSTLILSYIPYLYLFEILPVFILPLWALIITGFCFIAERKKIELTASIILILISSFITYGGLVFVCKIVSQDFFDIIYLHLEIIIPLIAVETFFVSLTTMLFFKKENYRRFEPILFFIIFMLLFWQQGNYGLTVFSHAIYAAIFALVFFIFELTRIILTYEFGKKNAAFFILFLPLIIIASLLLLKIYNKNSSANNGGLLQPTLFRFDFSDYLQLQSEIKMNDDLILIAHFYEEFSYCMLRRLYLSGWDTSKGFFIKNAPTEEKQITVLPKQKTEIPHKKFELREPVMQEYFFINFAPSSFIAMDYPTVITPYTIWNTSQFNGGYKVLSEVAYPFFDGFYDYEFMPEEDDGNLSDADFNFYTDIDDETFGLVHKTARELTQDVPGYLDKILIIKEYFTDGEYRYSLKPGKAPDGNQLKYFLTESKKGYCSYFAFAFALMLRSIKIPCRVAVGFFVQQESGIMNYFPVRANMAHAWVEVFVPSFGWISFDPTSQHLAEGENLSFSLDAGGEGFTRLLAEILENRNEIKENGLLRNTVSQDNFFYNLHTLFKKNRTIIVCSVLCLLIFFYSIWKSRFYFILKFSKNNRRIVLTAGIIFAKQKNKNTELSRKMYRLVQKAKFAPFCSDEDVEQALLCLKHNNEASKD